MSSERRDALLRSAFWLVLLVAALIIPQTAKPTDVKQLVDVMTFALAAMGLALLTGFSGQISIGHGAFMGIGAYATAILVVDHGWPWYGATALAVVASFAVGVLVGLPALRIRGTALALATLGLAVLFPQVIKRFDDVTGGSQGKRVPLPDRYVAPEWTGLADDQWLYYTVLAFLVLALVLMRNLVRSRVGRALISLRDNEVAGEVLGVNVAAYKVIVFGLSGLLAGLAGSLLVYRRGFVNAGGFEITLSIELLLTAVVGGIATISGPLVGAATVEYSREAIQDRSEVLSPVVFGGALIFLMMVMPDGIVGGARRAWRRLRAGRRDRATGAGVSSGPATKVAASPPR